MDNLWTSYNGDMRKSKIPMAERLKKKSGKLWMEVQKGKSPREAAREIGVDPKNAMHMVNTENYQALERSTYKEELFKHITLAQIAEEHIKVMTQDGDLGAKNTAIKLALDKVEPQGATSEEQEKIVVILK